MTNPTVLVTGATGKTGAYVVKQLIEPSSSSICRTCRWTTRMDFSTP